MSEYGELCHDMREETRIANEKSRQENTELITFISDKYGLKIHWFTPYQARVWSKDMLERFDFYPVSGKIRFGKKKFTRPRLEEWVVMVFHI